MTMQTPVFMQARFASACIRCGDPIPVGAGIEWEKGTGAWHVECAHLPIRPRAPRVDAPAAVAVEQVPLGTYSVLGLPGAGGKNYVTVRIKRPGANSNWHGKVLVEFLSGSDNDHDFTAFGELTPGGVRVWGRFKDSPRAGVYAQAVEVVVNGTRDAREAAGLAYAMASGNCYRCGRTLTVPASIHRGLGPDCAARE